MGFLIPGGSGWLTDQQVFKSNARILCDWYEVLRKAASEIAPDLDPVPVRGWMGGAELIACLRSLGGTFRAHPPFYGWVLSQLNPARVEAIRRMAPELSHEQETIRDYHGLLVIELEGERFLALRADEQIQPGFVDRALILAGRSLESTLALCSILREAHRKHFVRRISVFGTEWPATRQEEVSDKDLILPEDFKRGLLDYLDGFWRAAGLCAEMRIAPTRGVLFVGAPGTGKTLAIRHLLSRYPEARGYLLTVEGGGGQVGENAFIALLRNLSEQEHPAIVIIEDIDRLFETGAVTPTFFLNVLDGLFQPTSPVLWVATSNDPTKLEQNLLNRPGRFDRVFVFPLPDAPERARLIERYSPWPVDPEVLKEIARDSDGLAAAHLREVCYGAVQSIANWR